MVHERFQSVDKAQLARRFGAAARHYDAHARFQQEVGQSLLARMDEGGVKEVRSGAGLDLGCGTGFFLLAQAALRGSGARLVCGDAEGLPFADQSLDWVFSSLALQWCERPAQAFAELNRVLKPGGQVFFSTLLSGSLWQLREAWRAVDGRDHVNRFLTLPQLQQAARDGGFEAPALCPLTWSLAYPALSGLLRDLKGIGASQVNDERSAGLGHRQRLVRLGEAYERHRQPDGLLSASYEVCFGRLVRR